MATKAHTRAYADRMRRKGYKRLSVWIPEELDDKIKRTIAQMTSEYEGEEAMKTTLNTAELKELVACQDGFDTFFAAHGDKKVKLSEALDSNGWDDIWRYLTEAWENLSKRQRDDINLLGCDWAESCLHRFEEELPNDDRPRLTIEAKRRFIAGEIDEDDLSAARAAARAAAESAWSAAWAAWAAAESAWAAWAAAESAWSAAWAAEESAWSAAWAAWAAAWAAWAAEESAEESARSAVLNEMKADLRALFVKWESEQ